VGHPLVGDDGEVTELFGTHIDVTEQRLAREALQRAFDEIKKSEDRLRLVIDTIPTLVWRAGPEGIPDFLNQPALNYTGLSLDQAESGWPRAFHPEDRKGMLVKWSAIRASGMRGGLEARLLNEATLTLQAWEGGLPIEANPGIGPAAWLAVHNVVAPPVDTSTTPGHGYDIVGPRR
jgi:PAS domain-containing protein